MVKKEAETEPKFWRVKLVIGIKTYSDGKTEEEAIKNAYEKISENPLIEENILTCKLINGNATKPMSYEKMLSDTTKW